MIALILLFFACLAAVPTLLFALLWIVAVAVSRRTKNPLCDFPPSIDEADEILEDDLSPDCSPLNAKTSNRGLRGADGWGKPGGATP
jgi:hypothetical protein